MILPLINCFNNYLLSSSLLGLGFEKSIQGLLVVLQLGLRLDRRFLGFGLGFTAKSRLLFFFFGHPFAQGRVVIPFLGEGVN
jgi:hypothetical protein